jgi:hypothetical protein
VLDLQFPTRSAEIGLSLGERGLAVLGLGDTPIDKPSGGRPVTSTGVLPMSSSPSVHLSISFQPGDTYEKGESPRRGSIKGTVAAELDSWIVRGRW